MNLKLVAAALVLAFFFTNCSSKKCLCIQPIADTSNIERCAFSSRLEYRQIRNAKLTRWIINPYFKFCIYERGDSFYLVSVTMDKEIHFNNLTDTNGIHHASFDLPGNPDNYSALMIVGDTMHVLNNGQCIYTKLLINPDFSTTFLETIDLKKLTKDKEWFVRSNDYGKPFEYRYPYLFVPYGKRHQYNLYDKQAYLVFDTKALTSKQLFDYPACYTSCYVHDENTGIAISKNGDVSILFSDYDELQDHDLNKGIQRKLPIPFSKPFKEYDKADIANLAYARKFEYFNDKNTNIFFLDNGDKIVIKRLAKQNFIDPFRYKYYLFDSTSRLLCTEDLPFPIVSAFARPYKNGFVVFNDSLTKIQFYERN